MFFPINDSFQPISTSPFIIYNLLQLMIFLIISSDRVCVPLSPNGKLCTQSSGCTSGNPCGTLPKCSQCCLINSMLHYRTQRYIIKLNVALPNSTLHHKTQCCTIKLNVALPNSTLHYLIQRCITELNVALLNSILYY